MKKDAIIIGAGTYGQVYASYLEETYQIIGFYDDNVNLHGQKLLGVYVMGNILDAMTYVKIHPEINVFIPIGNNLVRRDLVERFLDIGAILPSYIHPNVEIHKSVRIGNGVYILPGCNIMPLSTIGDYTMISMGVNIAHHTDIGAFCFFSQGSNIGASISIEDFAYCGIASTIMTGVKRIGKNSLIGAGSVVIKDVSDNSIMAGVPSKILRIKDPVDQL